MPRIAQNSIESIKQQVNLVDVVSPYSQLKRAGKSWKGLSPFTQEKTPSFYVHPDRGFYKCFSTGEGGDCFTFIMKLENLEFSESVEFLAKKFNINLEYEAGGPSREEVSLRKQVFQIHELATDWFHEQFMRGEEAVPVRTYWKEDRGFDRETAEEVRIGYAPVSINALALYLQEKGITTDAMQQSGLFFARDYEKDHSRFKSRFRGRLMIPIRDVQGRVVAFTARQLPQTPQDDPAREAKYINSPETAIFHKSRILFGMDHARTHLKEGGYFIMVEGQLDAIRCWSVGLHTAVAPQGTAITEEQLHLMRRYEPAYIECLLDGDKAGRKAAIRILPLAFKAGLEFRFLLLPEKADPDDLLRTQGPDALEPLRKKASSAIELAISEHLPEDRIATTHEKTVALRAVFELLQHVPSEVAREDYIQTAAKLINVDPSAALRDFQKARSPARPTNNASAAPEQNGTKQDPLLTQATWELLWLVSHYPEYGNRIAQIIDYEWINTPAKASSLLSRILAEHQEGLIEDHNSIENLVDSLEDRQLLAEIHTRELNVEDPKAYIETCLKKLASNYLNIKKKHLENRIANIDPKSDELLFLMKEVKQIRKMLSNPDPIEI
jgi:DNA primase